MLSGFLIQKVMFIHRYVLDLANDYSQIERDLELLRYYLQHVTYPGDVLE
jgi:hypothetical protein